MNNNPVMLVDPDGHFVWMAINAGFAAYDGYKAFKKGGWKAATIAVGVGLVGGAAFKGAKIAYRVYKARRAQRFLKGLGNPFKGKTFKEIEDMFIKKGFEKRGSDPLNGKGGYVNPKTRRSYYLDKGGHYKKVMSLHTLMSIGWLKGSKRKKEKYFLK
ncbi:hypothetical protein [Aeribacillus pallidus]|uniref:hypothetical protein n=1 Tax=Aeribacillus pallidus TaxID=33936 RepID=UPI001F375DFF|nr:hypothetical protein [Aeribacillus pallidus]